MMSQHFDFGHKPGVLRFLPRAPAATACDLNEPALPVSPIPSLQWVAARMYPGAASEGVLASACPGQCHSKTHSR